MHRTVVALLIAAGLAFPAGHAWANGTPDGRTPAQEHVCDGLTGAVRGICIAYCEAQDCDMHPRASCSSLRKKYQQLTGSPVFPCDRLPCLYSSAPACGGTCPSGQMCTTVNGPGWEGPPCVCLPCGH